MAGKITGRFPTVDYGYVEIESDDFTEYVELEAAVVDHLSNGAGYTPGATEQAQQNLQDAGVTQSGLQGAGRPSWQQNRQQGGSGNGNAGNNNGGGGAKYKKLGTDPLTGREITIEYESRFGKPYVKDGQDTANLPDGVDKYSVTVQDAAGYLAAKRNGS